MAETEANGDGREVEHWRGNQVHMKAEVETHDLRRKIAAVAEIVDEFRLHFDEDCLRVNAIDPANVCMVMVEIPVDYQTDVTEFETGVISEDIQDAISIGGADSTTRIQVFRDDEDARVASGAFMNYLTLHDPETFRKEPDPLEIDFPATATVESMKFKGAVGGVAGAADGSVRMTSKDDSLLIEGEKAGEGYEYSWEIEADVDGEASHIFSYDYLSKITASIEPTGETTIWWGNEEPLLVSEGDGVQFALAPRIQAPPEGDDD